MLSRAALLNSSDCWQRRVDVIRASTASKFADAIKVFKAAEHSTVIHLETDPMISAPDFEAWWDVPVSQISTMDFTQQTRSTYEEHKATQRVLLKSEAQAVHTKEELTMQRNEERGAGAKSAPETEPGITAPDLAQRLRLDPLHLPHQTRSPKDEARA
jgi:hypothetical protein